MTEQSILLFWINSHSYVHRSNLYHAQLSPAEEIELQQKLRLSPREEMKLLKRGRSQSYLYLAQVRHPASRPTGREQPFFFLREANSSRHVFLMKGALGFYFVAEEHLKRLSEACRACLP